MALHGGGGGGSSGSSGLQLVNQSGAVITSGHSWTWSTNTNTVDFTGLAGAKAIMVYARNLTNASTQTYAFRVSTNNGSSYASGASDYESYDSNGQAFGQSSLTVTNVGSGSARSFIFTIWNPNLGNTYKLIHALNWGYAAAYVGSTTAINAIQILTNGSGVNITGGTIDVLVQY